MIKVTYVQESRLVDTVYIHHSDPARKSELLNVDQHNLECFVFIQVINKYLKKKKTCFANARLGILLPAAHPPFWQKKDAWSSSLEFLE